MDEISEVFHIPARLCKRCGGLLTSEQALKDGYGHTSKDQYSLFEGDPLPQECDR